MVFLYKKDALNNSSLHFRSTTVLQGTALNNARVGPQDESRDSTSKNNNAIFILLHFQSLNVIKNGNTSLLRENSELIRVPKSFGSTISIIQDYTLLQMWFSNAQPIQPSQLLLPLRLYLLCSYYQSHSYDNTLSPIISDVM